MAKIDKKDKALLYELSKDCRIPLSTLAKRVGLSRELVDYRLRRLIKKKVIVDFITDIDETKLGFSRYLIYQSWQNVDEETENEIIKHLTDHNQVSWITTTTGKWTVIFDLIAKSIDSVNEFIERLKSKYPGKIGEYLVLSIVEFKHYNSKYYNKETIGEQPTREKDHKLDEVDLKLLRLLSNNARLSYAKMSKELDLTANTIKNRIMNLKKSGVIKSFFIQPDKQLLGFQQYYLHLSFANDKKEDENNIMNYLKHHKNVNAYYKPLGQWSIEVAVFVENGGQLRRFILDLRNKFSNKIKINDTMLFYEEPKSNYLPASAFA
jgi:DNA-binding Lrp family transcriptional regulator